ncbi:MAG: hypothetical protein MUE58_10945, partial [Chitinophagaceae bacterium]|nr:hypothetical protein [Chitinophagaceae bacterium]
MKTVLQLLFLCVAFPAWSQNAGNLQHWSAIGNPALKGTYKYDSRDQSYTLSGGGYNIWFNRDEFQFLHTGIKGDFILTANFAFPSTAGDAHKKVGWMIRESLQDDASHISATYHADGLTALQWRVLRGAYMRDPEDEIFSTKKHPQVMQLERTGNTITMRVANPGEPLQVVGSQEMANLPDSVFAGLFICSHNADRVDTARVWNVRVEKTVPNTWHPNPAVRSTMNTSEQSLGGRMEILDVFTG